MSRTNHHRNQKDRHRGHDLWKPGPVSEWPYCAYSKRVGRRLQRKRDKQETKKIAGV